MVFAAALALAFLVGRDQQLWEDDIAALSPIPESLMARDRHLYAQLGVPDTNHVLLVKAPDVQAALGASEVLALELEQLVDQGVITSFDLAARYLPSVRTQLARQQALPGPTRLGENLARALAGPLLD